MEDIDTAEDIDTVEDINTVEDIDTVGDIFYCRGCSKLRMMFNTVGDICNVHVINVIKILFTSI